MKCKNCGEKSEFNLCKSCYYDKEDGLIDECKCGNYKDSEYDLCLSCYKKNKSFIRKKTKISDSSIKGRLAEAIVEEMFLSMSYQVFRFGMENTLPGFSGRYLTKKGDVANQVRKMPDFIVVKDNQINFVEVKYRTKEEDFDFNAYYGKRGPYPYKNCYFILVSPKHIKIQKASELEKGKDFIYLGSCKDFDTDKEIIVQYVELCKKFFGNC